MEDYCEYYSNLFFKMLVKKAYRNVNMPKLKIIHNICNTGTVNIIATDGRYNYDLYIKQLESKNKKIEVFEISRYSEFSTYSDSKIYSKNTLEEITKY